MKINNIFYILVIIIAFALSANAYATNDELTSPEALLNYDYSVTTAETVQLIKARNANRPYKNPRYSKKKWWQNVWEYFDPSTDNGYLMQHDIKPQPHWTDL